jgi:uncharacterized protein (DUF58 family)
MPRLGVSKVLVLDTRHPGLIQKVEAMFEAFVSIAAVTAMIRSEYGERISYTTIRKYKRQFWSVRRKRDQAARAAMTAYQELVSEGRN